jgi:hypothetical protein
MQGQVIGALLGRDFFSVALTREADLSWQQEKPYEFYDHVIDFYRAMHPSIVGCAIRWQGGEEYPAINPGQNTAEPPPGPVPTT